MDLSLSRGVGQSQGQRPRPILHNHDYVWDIQSR
jgi:hypothetical protein